MSTLQWIEDQRLAAMRSDLPLARNEESEAKTQVYRGALQLELVQRRVEGERAACDARFQVLVRQDAHLLRLLSRYAVIIGCQWRYASPRQRAQTRSTLAR